MDLGAGGGRGVGQTQEGDHSGKSSDVIIEKESEKYKKKSFYNSFKRIKKVGWI